MAHPPTSPAPTAQTGRFTVHLKNHARGLSAVVVASAVGILASFAFQVVTARYLGAADFGLLAAFFVIVNVAAIGSSALQNSVTVHTASELAGAAETTRRVRRWPVDAIALGVGSALAVGALSPWLADALDTTVLVVVAAAATIPLSFVFADAMGLLQGSGQVSRAVWWSTLAQVARVVLALGAIVIAAGLAGMIGAVVAALVFAVAGAAWSTRHVTRPRTGVFSSAGITIIVLTVAFAWLTSSDVLFLRAGAPESLAGMYAAVTVLVKTGFLLPATLSFYLLPRFVRNRDNPQLSRLGVWVTLALSLATSAVMTIVFALIGPWLIVLLYGADYAAAADLLVPASLAYLPWIAAQGMLIKMTSNASRGAAALLVGVVVAQAIAFTLLVPDVSAMLLAYGILGAVVLISFLAIDLIPRRRNVVSAA